MSSSQLFLFLTVCLASALAQELCDDDGNGQLTAILPDSENQLLVLKGDSFWKLTGNLTDGFSLVNGYPKKIASYWTGFPKDVKVDGAAYDIDSTISYLVKDEQTWAFKDHRLEPGYPKVVSEDPFFASDEDASSEDEKRISELAIQNEAVGIFPFELNHMYFFKGTQYTKYRLPSGPVEDGYPKSVVPFWFQCPQSSSEK